MSNNVLRQFNLSDEEYLNMDEVEFRARFRERVHHTLEIQTYAAANGDMVLTENQNDTAKRLVRLWEKRNLSRDLPEYVYAKKLIDFSEKLLKGENLNLSEFEPYKLSDEDINIFFKVIKERRSVRHFKEDRVPDGLIDKILESGLWAAHSCNLQSIKYLVVREETTPGLFKGSDVPGGPVHLVVLQDERVYRANPLNPVRNRLIDVGAAAQNMVLAAHALGLGGVWLTFNDAMIDRISKFFSLPEYIKLVTYVDIGYPNQTPYAPQRKTLDEAVIARV
ncbi:MAG: nitroreductase family protein [Bacillota bacterium]